MTIENAVVGKVDLPNDQNASGRQLGEEELALLREVIESGTLTSTKGHCVADFEKAFASTIGAKHAVACSSGTAAVHAAIAAIDPEPGDEVITTPITDMGAIAPILYQGAIPVFADVDPRSFNVTAATIAARLSSRTRAIVVTHLFGNPCDMRPIVSLAESLGLPLIEDCAQAFLARAEGRTVGTLGRVGAFSLQQGKHVTTGEGGIVVTDDDALARRMRLFVNKAWPYGEAVADHEFLALNYRISELTGAVALAQLEKLPRSVARRRAAAERLTRALRGLPGVETPSIAPGHEHVYWKYTLSIDPAVVEGGCQRVASELRTRGIASAPRYIQKPAFECAVIRDQKTFGASRFPFNLAAPEAVDYRRELFPGAYEALERILVLPWNERYEDGHVDAIAAAIHDAVAGSR